MIAPSRISTRLFRQGFLITEVAVALAVLAVAAVLVAQLGIWTMNERLRMDAQLEATEVAANILERARARPWADLTPDWASGQRLPEYIATRWPDCRLSVKVEPEPNRPRVTRVTVEVKWTDKGRMGWRPVALIGLFATHMAEGKS